MRTLLLLLVIIPIVEMWLLITVGQHMGAVPTIALVLLTAFMGISLLRYQGAMTLLKARMKMNSGEMPAREMADGLFFAVGGALLLTPGFVTDAIGFACLTPGIRTVLISFFAKNLFSGQFNVHSGGFQSAQKTDANDVLEGDFERHKDES
ncbi:MAG: UPF0716 protein FxsA [Kiritimatiellia bacterium]